MSEPKPRIPLPKNLTGKARVEFVLTSWEHVTQHLKILKPEEILSAIKHEKARENGPRLNIVYRLGQRYDQITKNERMAQLIG